MGGAPLGGVGVAASLGAREVVVDLLHGYDLYVEEFDRDGRAARGVEHREALSGRRQCLAGVLVDLQQAGESGLVAAQDRRHAPVAFRPGKGEFEGRKVVVLHWAMVRSRARVDQHPALPGPGP